MHVFDNKNVSKTIVEILVSDLVCILFDNLSVTNKHETNRIEAKMFPQHEFDDLATNVPPTFS